jgi:hypothetical protein
MRTRQAAPHQTEIETIMPTYYLNPQESRFAAWYLTFDSLSDAAKLSHAEEQAQNARFLGSSDGERVWRTVIAMIQGVHESVPQALAS